MRDDRASLLVLVQRIVPGVLGNASWSTLAAVFDRISSLTLAVVVARVLGKDALGVFGLLTSTTFLFSLSLSGGLGLTATRQAALFARTGADRSSLAGRLRSLSAASLLLGGLVSLVLFASAGPLCATVLRTPALVPFLRAFALSVPFLQAGALSSGFLQGLERFSAIAVLRVCIGGFRLLLVWGAACRSTETAYYSLALSYGLEGLAYSLVACYFVGVRNISPSLRGLKSNLRLLFAETLPAFATSQIGVPLNWAAQAFLVRLPGGEPMLGTFNAANQWRMVALFLPARLQEVLLPRLTKESDKGCDAASRLPLLLLSVVIAACGTLTLLLLARPVLSLYGTSFVESSTVPLYLLAVTCIPQVMSDTASMFLVADGRLWIRLLSSALGGIVLAAAAYVLCPLWGPIGLAVAHLLHHTALATLFAVAAFGGQRRHTVITTRE